MPNPRHESNSSNESVDDSVITKRDEEGRIVLVIDSRRGRRDHWTYSFGETETAQSARGA
jgi:hypothetical protein